MELGTTFKPLAISLFTAIALTACGGSGGDGGVADRTTGPNNIPSEPKMDMPNNNTNNQIRSPNIEEWRRIDGFKNHKLFHGQTDAIRQYSENTNTILNGVRRPQDYSLKAYYFNGGKGLHHISTPGGGIVDYYNMSYATFGNYKNLVNNFDDIFFVAQGTPSDKVPITGNATYSGPILYRGTQDGNISLNVNFSTRDITGRVENLSLFNRETMKVKADAGVNYFIPNRITIGGQLESEVRESDTRGVIEGVFAGPNAEEIVGDITRTDHLSSGKSDDNEAVFGATRQ